MNTTSNSDFGLTKNVLEKIRNVFSAFPQIDEVIIFSQSDKLSFKNGTIIDFSVIGENLPHKKVNKIRRKLDELRLPYTYQLVLLNTDNQAIIDHLKRTGNVFYTKKKSD